jgi:hypothetical protein
MFPERRSEVKQQLATCRLGPSRAAAWALDCGAVCQVVPLAAQSVTVTVGRGVRGRRTRSPSRRVGVARRRAGQPAAAAGPRALPVACRAGQPGSQAQGPVTRQAAAEELARRNRDRPGLTRTVTVALRLLGQSPWPQAGRRYGHRGAVTAA